MLGDRTRGNRHKLLQRKRCLDKRKKVIFVRAIQPRNHLPMKWWKLISSLEVLKAWLNWALYNLVYGSAFKRRSDLGTSKDTDFSVSPQIP